MTIPKLPESEEEKWSPQTSLRIRLLSLCSLSRNFHNTKQLLIIPFILIIFSLGYILAYIKAPPHSSYLPGGSQYRLAHPSDPNILPIPPTTSLDSSSHPSILLFQHFSFHDSRVYHLQTESIARHERYARYWGYGYIRSFETYVRPSKGKTTRQKQMNKLYGLLKVVLGELEKGDKGAEWIMVTDADTLIINPIVPIHSLLPLLDLHKETPPLILGTEDHNGFNSGAMILRSGLDLIAFLSKAITISESVTWDYEHPDLSSGQWKGVGAQKEIPPSDQRAICLTLQSGSRISNRYYPYPAEWINSYSLPNDDDDMMVLQIHLVNHLKYKDFSMQLNAAREAWKALALKSPEEVQERVTEIEARARRHWETVQLGAPRRILI